MSAMTPAQKSVLDYVQSFQLANGCPPTREEIAGHFKWRSANAAQEHLRALQAKGVIRLVRGQSRGTRIVNETETLSLPQRTPIQLQAIKVRNIWDQEGCHSAQFPEALTTLLNMVLEQS